VSDTIPRDWLGELWSATETARPTVDALGRGKRVTSLKVAGWRYTTAPAVAPYAGDKAQIPSNPVVVDVDELPVTRIAGGHDVDRALFDLASADYVAAHLRSYRESYAAQSNAHAAAAVVAAATVVPAAAPGPVSAIITAALAVRPRPTAILCASDVFAALAHVPDADRLAHLGITVRLGGRDASVSDLTAEPDDALPSGVVLAVNRGAVSWHETDPINVQAVDVARGGIDVAMFGYVCAFPHDARGIAAVTMTTAAPTTARRG